MTTYYNEIDPFAAAWLRELIRAGHIAPGDVDERSIEDVRSADLVPYTQCHFFAGIGGWSLAARLAGIPDDYPLWTGSAPCQPFSSAGKQRGTDDERHLWPVLADLIRERRPSIVAGEQVASALGRDWLASVRSDLEGMAYAVGAADLCAAGVGAHHVRQRLYWGAVGLADPGRIGHERRANMGEQPSTTGSAESETREQQRSRANGCGGGDGLRLADAGNAGPQGLRKAADTSDDAQRRAASEDGHGPLGRATVGGSTHHEGWADLDWLHGRDGRWRPTRPGTFPLAHGVPARVGRLRGYGNAIVPQVGAAFLRSLMEAA